MDKYEKSSKMLGNFLVNFVTKSKKLLWIIYKASIRNNKCHTTKCSCPKKLVWNFFLDTILHCRSLCKGGIYQLQCSGYSDATGQKILPLGIADLILETKTQTNN